ncbi:hypothetical protein WN943_019881 [Citrus x changshan-huyou]
MFYCRLLCTGERPLLHLCVAAGNFDHTQILNILNLLGDEPHMGYNPKAHDSKLLFKPFGQSFMFMGNASGNHYF